MKNRIFDYILEVSTSLMCDAYTGERKILILALSVKNLLAVEDSIMLLLSKDRSMQLVAKIKNTMPLLEFVNLIYADEENIKNLGFKDDDEFSQSIKDVHGDTDYKDLGVIYFTRLEIIGFRELK